MSEKKILFHKKNNKGLSLSALAVHGSTKGRPLVAEPVVTMTRAQAFLQGLKRAIKKAV